MNSSDMRKAPAASGRRNVFLAMQCYYHGLHSGIARYARDAHWRLNSWSTRWHGESNFRIAEIDGVVATIADPHPLLQAARKRRVPVVDLCWARPDFRVPRVLPDHEAIGADAARYFLERGFWNLAFCGQSQVDWKGREILHGFRSALASGGMDCHDVTGPSEITRSSQGTRLLRWFARALRRLPKPLAILAQEDGLAAELLNACELARLDVPVDVAVLGCDNDELICPLTFPPLSSVDNDLERQGYEGARLLDRLMNGEEPPAEPIRLPHKGIVTRQSTDVLAVEHRPLASAIQFIWRNYADPALSVERIAEGVGMTRQGLDKACHQHLGRSVSRELKRVRLDRAQTLLRETRLGLEAIAKACGYSRAQVVRETILRATGLPPLRYRRTHSANAAMP